MAIVAAEPLKTPAVQAEAPARPPARSRGLWMSALVMAAHLPLLAVHLRNLWLRQHYQFFPLMLLAIGWMIWQRLPSRDAPRTRSGTWLENLMVLVGSTLMLTAFLLFTPWLGALAALVTAGGILRRLAGPVAWRQVWPYWAMAWIILPPPFALDIRLTQALQRFTAWCSSAILDMFGIKHLMEGTVLDFPGRSLLVEEACSGIQSLFTLLACTLFYVVYKRRGIFVSLVLLASAVLWASLANILRVVTVALAYDRLGSDLATGWRHELLGFVVFGLAVALLASTDALLYFLFGPIVIVPQRAPLTRSARFWNYFVSGARAADIARILGRPAAAAEPAAAAAPPSSTARRRSLLASPAFAVFMGLVAVSQVAALGIAETSTAERPRLSSDEVLERIAAHVDEDFFTGHDQQWKRTDFRLEERDMRSDFGRFSRVWEYEASFGKVIVSFDYPFQGFHPLYMCYRNGGWRLGAEQTAVPKQAEDRSSATEFELSKPTGEQGYVCFSLFDRDTGPVQQTPVTPGNWLRAKISRSPVVWLLGAKPASLDNSSYQFQIFAVTGSRLTDAEREELRGKYFELRDHMIQQWNEHVTQLAEPGETPPAAKDS